MFVGTRKHGRTIVTKDGLEFHPVLDVMANKNLHYGGWEWGQHGRKVFALAYAILNDVAGRDTAARFYQQFANKELSTLGDSWSLDQKWVRYWIERAEMADVQYGRLNLGMAI